MVVVRYVLQAHKIVKHARALVHFTIVIRETPINIYDICICVCICMCVCCKYTRTLAFLMKNINFIDHIAIILMSFTRKRTRRP